MRDSLKQGRPQCPKCGFKPVLKAGVHCGRQRYRCPECGYQFTSSALKGKNGSQKALALALYSSGVSYEAIGKLLNVTMPAVFYWVKEFGEKNFQKPAPAEMVKIPMNELIKYLPQEKSRRSHIVFVPVDEATGEIAGMIKVPAQDLATDRQPATACRG